MAVGMLLLCAGIACYGILASAGTDNDKISKGVFINTVDVSGMTRTQATDAVNAYLADRQSKKLTLKIDNNTVVATIKDLGYQLLDGSPVDEALMVGKSGNLLKRYKELKDIEKDGKVIQLDFGFDDAKVQELVEKQGTAFDIPAKNAMMKRVNGAFQITDEVTGRKIVVDETVAKIKTTLLSDWDGKDITIDAVVIDDIPQFKRDSLEKVDTVLGSYQTSFATSTAARAQNLNNGASLIDGIVLYPGETFSAYEHLQPFTLENGYATAGAYSQGKVIDSVGGGVCQVSTTLYNAVLRAELEVVERFNHSMIVSYVQPSMDAAIAGTFKDFKFKNNLPTPIYIQGYTSGRTIFFNIFGEETRDVTNRRVEYVSEITSTTQPPKDVITEDPTQPKTYKMVTQTAHVGYTATLYKVVYLNGEQSEKTEVNSSVYKAAPAYIVVGTKEEKPKTPDTTKDGKTPSKAPAKTDPPKTDTTQPGEDTATPGTPAEDEAVQDILE